MNLVQYLIEGFDYDAWANRQWIKILPQLKNSARAREIMQHILRSERVWLERCLGDGAGMPNEAQALEDELNGINTAWKEFLSNADPAAYISYKSLSGVSYMNTLENIARHVINHGTYHRGQLRGLAEAEGTEDFPETDFIRFTRET